MNIEKLAKHLKEFTLDEIEMIAECDCKAELEQLLNSNKMVFEQGIYKYKSDKNNIVFGVFIEPDTNNTIKYDYAVEYFLNNYAYKKLAKRTAETYESIFKVNITPFFREKILSDITNNDIKEFYIFCKKRNLGVRRLQSSFVLLNQLLKYCRMTGLIKRYCNFQVRRITSRNEFDINRIIFED